MPFRCVRVTRPYDVVPVFRIAAYATPSKSLDHSYTLNLELDNTSELGNLRLAQLTTLSPMWTTRSLGRCHLFVNSIRSRFLLIRIPF